MEKEYRNIGQIENFDEESRKIQGYALKFDSESQYMGFYEKIDRSALTEDVLAKSDIFALLNHDSDKVLARNRYGQDSASLKLELREDGLYYEFEAPHTQYGDELIEHLKRGEIFASSFAFSLPVDSTGDVRSRDEKGVLHRTITKIARLYDVSPVFEPAYLATSCTKRTLNILEEIKMEDNKKEELELRNDEDVKDEDVKKENENDEEDVKEDVKEEKEEVKDNDDNKEEVKEEEKEEVKDNDDNKEDDVEEEKKEDEESKEDDKQDEKEEINKEQKNKNNINIMKKNFSLLRAISDIAKGKSLDPIANAVVLEGQNELRNAGMGFEGQIQLPIENRATVTVNVEGEDVVATDIFDILEPLRAKNVLVQAGASVYSGLVGNVKIPVMGASNVTWEGETSPAKDGAGTFTHVELSPKRLTAYIDISKQFLIQTDNLQAEAKIRQDLINAITSKLESTILGDAAGSTTQPAGIFNGVTPTAITSFANITELEAAVEGANVFGECKYIMDPKSKAVLRNMARSADNTRLVMEGGEVDGTQALITSNMGDNKLVYGDFSNIVIGQWGAIDLTVDPYTQATNGCVRLVVNAFFDAKVARSEALAFGDTKQS